MKRLFSLLLAAGMLIVCLLPCARAEENIYCWNCGKQIPVWSNYCWACGSKVVKEETAEEESGDVAVPEAGSEMTFGRYEQDNDERNGAEAIEWLVLETDEENGRVLLVSKYALDARPYNDSYEDTAWESCSLSVWLNETFLNTAFSAAERQRIATTWVDNSKLQGYSGYETDGENDTTNRIFLLSYAEAWKYFETDADRQCENTAYAAAQAGAHNAESANAVRGACGWWLRSPGQSRSLAAMVDASGARSSYGVSSGSVCIRPAFWYQY